MGVLRPLNRQPPRRGAGHPRNERSAQTRCPSTRKGLGRKAKPRACPDVTVGLGQWVSLSLLAPPLLTAWLASWRLWSCVLGEGLVGTPSVSLLAPRFTPAAKTPAQTRCKAPRAAEHPRPGPRLGGGLKGSQNRSYAIGGCVSAVGWRFTTSLRCCPPRAEGKRLSGRQRAGV